MRTPTLLLLAVAATAVPVGVGGVAAGGPAPEHAPTVRPAAAPRSAEARALAVLRNWDRRRSAAWSAGDPGALARLYAPASRTGARDARDLTRWVRRGLRVTGLRQQVTTLALVHRDPRRIVVVVTDRTVDGVAVGAGRRTAVPSSAWATQRVVLIRTGKGWRVDEVWAHPAR